MKKINIVFLALLLFAVSACDDFLDVKSKTYNELDKYFTTANECKAATGPLYNKAWYDFSSQFYFAFGDGRANNLFSPYSQGDVARFTHFTEVGSTPQLQTGWQSLYIVVTQSDNVINNIDKALTYNVPLATVNGCKAEARFMRGLAYWYLGSTWGNVPIIEDPVGAAKNYMVHCNNFEDVLQYAIRDMEFAAQWLPETDAKGRLTKYSAYGALARLYITAACYARGGKFTEKWPTTAAEYYVKAKNAASIVINNDAYALMDDYEQLFRVQNNNNSESLFALQFVPGSQEYGVGNRNQDWLAYSTALTNGLTAYNAGLYISGELVNLMHTRGETKRKIATFFYPGATYNYLGKHTPAGKWTAAYDGGTFKYPLPKKHVVGSKEDTDGKALNGNSGLATPMIRLAEVYLLYAEAILGLNTSTADVEALKYFNKVRSRALLSAKASITLDDIWDERRCELALEGQFWFDMVRRAYWDQDYVLNYMANQNRARYYYYMSNTAPTGFAWRTAYDPYDNNTPTVDRLVMPLPENELVLNPNLREESVPFNFE